MELEKIKKELLKGRTIEEILENFDWKDFEKTVSEIFLANNFKVKQNFIFKTKRRYEIDVLAIDERFIFCVDCKEWSRGRYKKTGLKYAAKDQEERLKQIKKFLKKNLIARQSMKIDLEKQKFYPFIVTLFEEDLLKENETLFVPVWKLNSFLLNMEKFL
jgi:Holliday junction resolvase-like predicted endonuclease